MNAMLCVLMLGGLFGNARDGAEDKVPTVRDLVEQAPVIDSQSPEIRTLEVEAVMVFAEGVEVFYYASYVAPDRYMLVMADRRDGVPLALVEEGKLLLYDPVRGAVIYSEPTDLHFGIWRDEYRMFFGADFTGFGAKKSKPSRILLDFHSVLEPSTLGRWGDALHRAEPIGTDRYRVVRDPNRDARIQIDFDRANPSIVRGCEILARNEAAPLYRLTRLSVNQPLGRPPYRFPSKPELEQTLPVIDLTGVKLTGKDKLNLAVALAGCTARSAALDPNAHKAKQLHKLITQLQVEKVDLAAVRANDQRLAPLLRQLTTPRD